MEKRTKVTKIEKKYKDKKTGDWKSITIEYAKINDRLKMFWEENPRGKIETTPLTQPNGQIMFRTFILRDKADVNSREATGHVLGGTANEKDFEKLETLSVGRALALLGYSASGEIASSEEMEEFNNFQESKKEAYREEMTDRINSAKTLEELKEVWASIDGNFRKELEPLKDAKKIKLNENA